MKKWISYLYTAIINMIDHEGVEHAGYMSFMILLAVFPFLVFLIAFTSFLGASELGTKFLNLAIEFSPSFSVEVLNNRFNEILNSPPRELLNLAILGTIWTSSSFIECVRTILNKVYHVESPPNYLLRRLLSIVQFIIIVIFISVSMFIALFIPADFYSTIQENSLAHDVLKNIFIFVTLSIVVSSLYYFIPNVKLNFVDLLPGTVITVTSWIFIANFLSEYIVYYTQLSVIYGSLGSVIITLIFFYIVNILFIVGAEFNYILLTKRQEISTK